MCKIIICQKMNNHLWSWWICWFAVKNSFRFSDSYFVDFEKSSHDVLYKYIDICSIPNIFTFTVYQCAGCDVMTAESGAWWQCCYHWAEAETGPLPPLETWPGLPAALIWLGMVWGSGPGRGCTAAYHWLGLVAGWRRLGALLQCVGGRWPGVSVTVPTSSTWWRWARRHLAATLAWAQPAPAAHMSSTLLNFMLQ